ncbi:hypothetical protein ACWDTI_16580 [Gordonia sp. NPDC003424]
MSTYYFAAQALTTIAVLGYSAGYATAIRGNRYGRKRKKQGIPDRSSTNAFKPVLPLAICGLLILPVLSASGGLAGRFETRDKLTATFEASGLTMENGNSILLFVLNRLPAAAALAALMVSILAVKNARNYKGPARTRSIFAWLGVMISLIFCSILANPYSSSRYVAFAVIMVAFLATVNLGTTGIRLAFSVITVIGLIVIYPLATWFKRDSLRVGSPVRLSDAFYSVDFDGFQQTINTFVHVEESGYAFGNHILSAAFFFIPRGIWPGKAEPASLEIAESRGYSFENLSLPLWAEIYLDGGLILVVIALVSYGYLSSRLDQRYYEGSGQFGRTICIALAACQPGIIRGPLGAQVGFLGAVVLITVLSVYDVRSFGGLAYRRSRTMQGYVNVDV